MANETSNPFSIRPSTFISVVILLALAALALYGVEVSPGNLVLIYPWGWELSMQSNLTLVLAFFKGGLIGIFALAFLRIYAARKLEKQMDSFQQTKWKLEDAQTRIQQLEDEKKQLEQFNKTLQAAVEKQHSQEA